MQQQTEPQVGGYRPAGHSQDEADLAAHGYRQRLNRRLGSLSAFAVGYSYLSILTGMFELFGFGYGFSGPTMFIAWLIVFAAQMAVALCFAEFAGRYPLSGSIYQWIKHVAGPLVTWLTSWFLLIGSLVTVAAVIIALNIVLPPVWSGFAVFKDPSVNAVFLGCVLLSITTVINAVSVRLVTTINNIGVACEFVGAIVLIVLLAVHARRGPGVIFHTEGLGPGLPGYAFLGFGAAFLMGAVMPAYVFYGFDTAASLAEETIDPRRRAPRAILQAIAAAGITGGLLLLFGLMAAKTLDPAKIGPGGLPLIVTSVLGSTMGKLLLIDVAIAISVCTLAIQTYPMRLLFAMARDNRLPFAGKLAHVSERRRSPVVPAILTGLIVALITLIEIGQSQLFLTLTSVAIVLIYVPYFLTTGSMLRKRLRGEWPPPALEGKGLFTMGKYGLAVNALAFGYGVLMTVNLVWPRTEIYGAGVYRWGGLLFTAGVVATGIVGYVLRRHDPPAVQGEHRIAAESPAPSRLVYDKPLETSSQSDIETEENLI
jgi:urea carboxylase system permease